ncbi:MAG TPA: DUF1697 domain-containing protein [Candidatus Saccharimonadales bacterium]|nr:DUF1697 domain-containing protein [Candidatus Saccharimonadales bacterium]
MAHYVALLRGIGPGNPNMRNDKLREVFENLGFEDVQSVISSGNVLFKTDIPDVESLESTIENAIVSQLGFNSTTIIRSKQELEKLVRSDPFDGTEHGPSSYLLVTFLKNPVKTDLKFPYTPPSKSYTVLGISNRAVFTVTDTTAVKTPDVMTWLEKQFGKEISSRTWKTVHRILKKFEG